MDSGNGFDVSHSASSLTSSLFSLQGPSVAASSCGRESTRGAGVLLDVEAHLAASSALSVRLGVSSSESGSSSGLG